MGLVGVYIRRKLVKWGVGGDFGLFGGNIGNLDLSLNDCGIHGCGVVGKN